MPILYVRDENGVFRPIPALKGDDGKSAYEQAKEGGFQGTEEDFIAILNGLLNPISVVDDEPSHYTDFNNPHKVTAAQVGALPEVYNSTYDLNTELQQGGGKVKVCCYNEFTQNTPYTEGLTDCTHGMVITNAFSSDYSTQICTPSGEDSIYVRRINGSGISRWVKMVDNDELGGLQSEINRIGTELTAFVGAKLNIATGSYEGTNKHGSNNPLTLTFPFVPKVVFISPNKKASSMPFAWVYGSPIGITAYNNSQMFASNLTWNGNTLTWYTSDGYPSYQHNNSDTMYYWVAIG